MLNLDKYQNPLERAIKEKALKRGDWILFSIEYPVQCSAPPAILGRFESLDPLITGSDDAIRGFTLTEAVRIFVPNKISDGLFLPRVRRVNEDLGANENPPVKYSLSLPARLYIGKEEILKGFREISGLENYVCWFEQFLFK